MFMEAVTAEHSEDSPAFFGEVYPLLNSGKAPLFLLGMIFQVVPTVVYRLATRYPHALLVPYL